MPVIRGANRVKANPKHIPQFGNFMQFREEKLIEVVKRLSIQIRRAGGKSLGYFGQFFNSHDGIFCLGVIAALREELDLVAVDYNFFNGWTNICDVWKPALMANYAATLGYSEVIVGLYLERVRTIGAGIGDPVDKAIYDSLRRIGDLCSSQEHISGYELAGFGKGVDDIADLGNVIEHLT